MIKKLAESRYETTTEGAIKQKANEIIDYLEAKEASKGECKLEHPECATCKYFGDNCGNHTNPPEHEEEWSDLGDLLGNYRVAPQTDQSLVKKTHQDILDYIKDNFVSKEKIKREAENATNYLDKDSILKHEFLKSLGLGD